MKNYIKEIIDLFVHNDYSEDTNRKVWRWMSEERAREEEEEKEKVLRSLWDEARACGMPEGMSKSIRTMNKNLHYSSSETVHSRFLVKLRSWQAAAVFFLLFSAASFWWYVTNVNNMPADLIQSYIPCAEMQSVTLPDGTIVTLNSETTLLYPERFEGKTRSVFLIGEADFKVKPDKEHPFIVKSNDFQVTALGTEFQITAYPEMEEIAATLISGSVKVECNHLNSNVVLVPNEQLVYNKNTKDHRIVQPDMADETAWQRGELVFSNMDLEDIFTRLERKYPYTFVYSINNLRKDTYSFRFPPKATLNEVMNIITQVVEMDYQIKDKKCYILNRK